MAYIYTVYIYTIFPYLLSSHHLPFPIHPLPHPLRVKFPMKIYVLDNLKAGVIMRTPFACFRTASSKSVLRLRIDAGTLLGS